MVSVKNRKIRRVMFHAAVHVGNRVLNTVEPGLNGVQTVELTELGVLVVSKGVMQTPTGAKDTVYEDLVPFADIVGIGLLPEVAEVVTSKSKS